MSGRNRSSAHRQMLAYQAARIMLDQGVREFDRARRKAAERAGIGNRRLWPNNAEIQEALLQQQRLFEGERHDQELKSLREQALAAMRVFSGFVPRLVGPVLAGSADTSWGVRLHLFADSSKSLVLALLDKGIPWQEGQAVFRYGGGLLRTHPVFTFFAGDTPFELVVLPLEAQCNPPLDPATDRPQRGAGPVEVARLLSDLSNPSGR
jgi:hypothetical protein